MVNARTVFAGVVLASTLGCSATRIRIDWQRPARFVLPVEQPIAVRVEADGTPQNANTVVDAVVHIGQGQLLNKWLAVLPVQGELDLQLRRAGHNLVDAKDATLTVRVRPTRWSYKAQRSGGSGKLEARIEVADERTPGAQPVFADGYWATCGGVEPEAMARCARALAGAFLATLQPSQISAHVELDDSDPITHPGIELCREGQFEAAYLAFSDAATKAPGSAPVLYNLAVLAEARGEYDLAESMLTRATGIAGEKLYFVALERVRRARQDSAAMAR